jgi:hypothetical protein
MTPRYNATAAGARIWFSDGSSAGRVIDLAVPHSEGGMDPENLRVRITSLARGLSRIRAPRLPVRIGHAIDVRDPEAPIYTDGAVIPPGGAAFLDCECPDCDSGLVVLPNQEPGVTWFVVEHSASCPAFRAWVARRPR